MGEKRQTLGWACGRAEATPFSSSLGMVYRNYLRMVYRNYLRMVYSRHCCGFKYEAPTPLQSGIVLIQWFETLRNTNPVLLKSIQFFFSL